MKIFSVLFVLVGLMDACFGRSIKPETIKKRYREAKYGKKSFAWLTVRLFQSPSRVCELWLFINALITFIMKI